ncbi:metallophosphoesterase family protein [Dehalogenimonas etheniformans]|uniref:Nuclease SbcCD subunit D n=1 Tax=Dehalogenimonas etheniformans TaxID=1536648 RepID=A0A2P5P979_9CHLR|nr:exonuclease SbcCD subunit D [Dehalogenimonas etheniformans]PPD58859.1 exonuclease SbcCD subunit D [Dehalogenimonas etheniformans]QNT76373.1 exonuclease SbcCD subunit D [Dehalogenimonas etheniformans]
MKIIHFADLHLGVEVYGKPDPTTGLDTRLLDFLAAFDKLVDYAICQKVDLVLFCGDAFKSRDPSQTQQREFARRIRKLADVGIPVFLLIGNHDLPAASGRATSTEIYDTLRIPKVTVASQPKIYTIETSSGPVQIAALPWPRKSSFEGKAQAEGQNLSSDELKSKIEAGMSAKIKQMADSINPRLPSILAAHIWVDGAATASERKFILGLEPTVMLSNIALPAFDYVALGHLHKRQELSGTPPVVYSGSLERLDFGEERDDKGFYVIEIDIRDGRKIVEHRFNKLEGRRFLTLEKAFDEGELNPTASVLALIADRHEDITNTIVHLKLKMPESIAPLLRDAEIKNVLKDAYYFAISREVERQTRSRLGAENSESLSPLQALEKYLDMKNVVGSRRKELLARAEELLAETASK